MNWIDWVLLTGALVGTFVLWDFLFCDGRYCERVTGRGEPR